MQTQQKSINISTNDYRTEFERVTSNFTNRAVLYGSLAGVIMSVFLALSGFYITGEHAGWGFTKYLVLAIFLLVLLRQVKAATSTGNTLKSGFGIGLLTGSVAAIINAIAALIFGGKTALSGTAETVTEFTINRMTLAGMALFEGIVAGLIITFIILQFLKDQRPAS